LKFDFRPEARSFVECALYSERSTHQLDELLGDREPQPVSVGAAVRAVVFVVARENPGKRLVGNTNARVPHTKTDSSLVRRLDDFRADEHEPRLGELNRVADEVEKDLPDATAISDESSTREPLHLGLELEPLGCSARLHEGRHTVDEDAHVEWHPLELHLTLL
jgi:hypothetical protein